MENNILGIDIGTTTISFALMCEGRQIFSKALQNNFSSPEALVKKVTEETDLIIDEFGVLKIGLTGQMHGILCVDENGEAVSDYYNWQTGLCEKKSGDKTYAEEIKEVCGEAVPNGYGLSTLYYLQKNGLVREKSFKICTIADYLGMKLTKNPPLLHASNAASLGLFDVEKNCFKEEKIRALGISPRTLPEVINTPALLGEYKKIPVSVAIGDNQASVLAALGAESKNALCINVGTGAQVSLVSDAVGRAQEVRPYISGDFLLCGCAICGGEAYATLARFFERTLEAFGTDCVDVYAVMNGLAQEKGSTEIKVDTRFSGTREDESIRGSISGISKDNLTPSALVKGTLYGMAEELHSRFSEFEKGDVKRIVASGNGVKKNPALVKILGEAFGREIEICPLSEEAACGAAAFADLT